MLTNAERSARYRARQRGEEVPFAKIGPPFGHKQSLSSIEKAKRYGENHHSWKGNSICEASGRSRAQRLFKDIGACKLCGKIKSERHHIDGNVLNNKVENILPLCRRCHMQQDGRLEKFRELAFENHKIKSMEAIKCLLS